MAVDILTDHSFLLNNLVYSGSFFLDIHEDAYTCFRALCSNETVRVLMAGRFRRQARQGEGIQQKLTSSCTNAASGWDPFRSMQLGVVVLFGRKKSCSVVMMSLEDYNAIEETAYLLRSPANAQNLRESFAQYEEGKIKHRKIMEE